MEYLLRYGQPGLRQDLLIYGRTYKLWRNGKFLGTAIYTNDKHHGDVFLKKVIRNDSEGFEVFMADEWQLAVNNKKVV